MESSAILTRMPLDSPRGGFTFNRNQRLEVLRCGIKNWTSLARLLWKRVRY
jgi:hypothetical protein